VKNLTSMGLRVEGDKVFILDQEALPHKEIWLESKTPDDMINYIKALKIRGAPLIGVAAAVALAQFVETRFANINILSSSETNEILKMAYRLREARPTAVNLMAAVDRVILKQSLENLSPEQIIKTAEEIFEEDITLCENIGNHGAGVIENGDSVLTHCNAGGLATAGIGTAVGVIRRAFEQGKKIHVYVDETRPLLQGGRLTAWELHKLQIPFTLICDNMASMLMKQGKVQKIIVGSDRIASNGDFANKTGTYSVAVSASHHKVPFYVAAPMTTVDWNCKSGDEIPIEERHSKEVIFPSSSHDYKVYNPAFDVTPHELVTGYILDRGFFKNWNQVPKSLK
jgi:methylthioribose-1-phosphate isomerase